MLTIYSYCALKNPQGAKSVVAKHGMKPIHHPQALAKQLATCVQKGGEESLMMVRDIHPDKELFESNTHSNACGKDHSNACGCGHSNADGSQIKDELKEIKGNTQAKDNTAQTMIIGGVVLGVLALILKK